MKIKIGIVGEGDFAHFLHALLTRSEEHIVIIESESMNAEKIVDECLIVFFTHRGEQLTKRLKRLDKSQPDSKLWVDIDLFGVEISEEMMFAAVDTMCLRFTPVDGGGVIRIIGEAVLVNVVNRGSSMSQFFLEKVFEFLNQNQCKISIIKV